MKKLTAKRIAKKSAGFVGIVGVGAAAFAFNLGVSVIIKGPPTLKPFEKVMNDINEWSDK